MSKQDMIEIEGTVVEALPNATFTVELENSPQHREPPGIALIRRPEDIVKYGAHLWVPLFSVVHGLGGGTGGRQQQGAQNQGAADFPHSVPHFRVERLSICRASSSVRS